MRFGRRVRPWACGVLLGAGLWGGAADCSAADGATPPENAAFEGARIVSVSYEGETAGLDLARLDELGVLHAGSLYVAARARESVANMYQTGKFATIRVRARGVEPGAIALVYQLERARLITGWRFEGVSALAPDLLARTLDLSWGDRLNPERFKAWEELLRERYAREGYPRASLEVQVVPRGVDRVELWLKVREGEPVRVREVRIQAPGLDQATLRRLLETTPRAALSREDILRGVERIEGHVGEAGWVGSRVRWSLVMPDGRRETNHAAVMAAAPPWVDLMIAVEAGHQAKIEVDADVMLPEPELAKAITVYAQRSLSPYEIETSASKLQALYQSRGFAEAVVESEFDRIGSDTFKVRFKVKAGPQRVVGKVEFSGNETLSAGALKRIIQTGQTPPWQGPAPFDQAAWQDDMAALKEYYVKQGFLRARLTAQDTPRAHAPHVRDLHVQVFEGPRTLVGRIQFPGLNAYQQAGALQAVGVNPGDPYHPGAVAEWVSGAQAYMARLGFPRARVEAALVDGEDTPDATLRFTITRGPRKTVGRIIVRGNVKTSDGVVRRQITVQPGDFFDAEELVRTQQQIYQLGFFDRVQVEPLRPISADPDEAIDLVVVLHERETGWVGLGGGYGSLQGPQLSAEFLQNNLWGSGRPFRLEGLYSGPRATIQASLRDPYLLGTSQIGELGFSFLQERRRAGEPLYQTYGPTIGLSRPFGEGWLASVRYGWGRTAYPELLPEQVAAVASLPERTNSIVTLGLTHDARSDVMNPRWGDKLDLNVDWSTSLLGGSLVYLRPRVTGAHFLPLPRRIVLALGFEGGWLQPLSGGWALPTDLLFVSGGASSLRGYFNNVFPPGQPSGGHLMLVSHAELRTPLFADLGAVCFLDAGNVWGGWGHVWNEGIRVTGGLGLRYQTPVGPLRLDYGVRLHPRLEWAGWEGLYGGIGHAF
ncbi:MAG: outer membrane protein assembly factor BamA [Candidatus Sericytochromatia bacterium]|nr:outer membrane protein assembly factor BamA [Candidatus Sericytochromatia bacterium]